MYHCTVSMMSNDESPSCGNEGVGGPVLDSTTSKPNPPQPETVGPNHIELPTSENKPTYYSARNRNILEFLLQSSAFTDHPHRR